MLLIIAVTDTMADRADELHGKHTLFGRVIGDTIYSAFHQLNVKDYSNSYTSDVAKIGDTGMLLVLSLHLKHS